MARLAWLTRKTSRAASPQGADPKAESEISRVVRTNDCGTVASVTKSDAIDELSEGFATVDAGAGPGAGPGIAAHDEAKENDSDWGK